MLLETSKLYFFPVCRSKEERQKEKVQTISFIIIGSMRLNVLFLTVKHSLKYFYTASSGIKNFPSYVSAGLVDDVQISYCDSNINKNIPKQDWIKKVSSEYPNYWKEETQTCQVKQRIFKANLEIAKQRFNQTEGVHFYQQMYGCEWDDETGEARGYDEFGYDGEDLITLNPKTQEWIAPKPQAVITKHKWDHDKDAAEHEKYYLTQICAEWLQKYVNYGRSSLMRTDLPSVSLLQRTPSSPVSCIATGFYPKRAEMFWRKNGEEIHDGVDKGEILPNNDGTFQMSAHIDLRSVPTEDWPKYECVFQLYGVNDITNRLEKTRILTNGLILFLSEKLLLLVGGKSARSYSGACRGSSSGWHHYWSPVERRRNNDEQPKHFQ
uniref:H-2 class I histocompatibility antigen, K-K alpha chain-like n=1 Tax=Poecilia reticulata TaxID=8081 RepID=A0A3P9P1Q2_POERE